MTTYDALRASHLDDARAALPAMMERLSWSRDRIRREQVSAFRETLEHAASRSPWHRERLRRFDLRSVELEELPTMSKHDVMTEWDAIVTEPALRLADAESFYRGEREPAYWHGRYQVFASGGSSGRRGCYVWDWDTYVTMANVAFRHFAHDTAGRAGVRAVLTAGAPSHASTPLFTYAPDPRESVTVVSVMQPLPDVVAALERLQPTTLIGYSSVIHRVAEECAAGRCSIRPDRVCTNSEPLLDEMRRVLEETWGCVVNNSWGSTEVGVTAVQNDLSPGLLVAEDVILLERVDDSLEPVTDDQPSAKILVTALFNRTFPFIRYEMDDVVQYLGERSPDGSAYRMLGAIEGRQDDDFDYEIDAGTVTIHAIVFREPLGADPRVQEYQVHQTERGARVLVVGSEAPLERLRDQLVQSLGHHGLPDPEVELERVDAIVRHAETGKLKRFVARSKVSR